MDTLDAGRHESGAQPAEAGEPGGTPGPTARAAATFAPTEQFRKVGAHADTRPMLGARLSVRMRRDPQLLLAVAVTVPVVVLEAAGLAPTMSSSLPGLVAPAIFLAAQVWLTSWRSSPAWLPSARLWLSLAFVIMANIWADPAGSLPIRSLILPVVALSAARGGRGSILPVLTGLATMLVPLLHPDLGVSTRQEIVAVTLAAIVVALGSRSVVSSLERSRKRLQQANSRDRRHARQLGVVESVGRLLARQGPTRDALAHVMGVLEETFGYRYPSVYVWDGHALQLGAQRNYRFPIETISPDHGVIGRIVRTREAVFLPDVRSDPDFLSADPGVTGEIGIPLLSDGELLGVLNVETSSARPLARDDFAIMQIVGDRLAAALALGRERQKLSERASLLERLTAFATGLGSSLDPKTLDDEVATGAQTVIPADSVILVTRDDVSGAFLIAAVADGDQRVVGRAIGRNEGVSGRAIATRSVVIDDRFERARYAPAVGDLDLPTVMAAMAAPMLIGGQVIGAVSWLRRDLARPFSVQEREVALLLASKVGLAIANARLHQETRDAAIRDPLTGLHNRRHFDAALERENAVRGRIPAEKRPLRSAIMFDLDHFGKVNKQHGHQVGDRVLRMFADTLRSRTRASDLVARFGGEEFVVILDDASREEATTIAEDVRTAFAHLRVDIPGGEPIQTTVSAGCATLEAWEIDGSLLLERADVALAMAKAAGRDKVVAA